jgi:ankyrin repeat protein
MKGETMMLIKIAALLFSLFVTYKTYKIVRKLIKQTGEKVRGKIFLRNISVGNIPKIMKALKRGMNINIKDSLGNTPLILASCLNKKDIEWVEKICKILIEGGADINASNFKMHTPLIKAIENNNLKIAKLLLQAGANVKSRFRV